MQTCWKLGLRNSFKNFRRGHQQEGQPDTEPPAKRRRLYQDDDDQEDITQEEYDNTVKNLKGIIWD